MANFYQQSEIPAHLLEFFVPAEIGKEKTPAEFVAALVAVFREVKRVLRDDGTLWLNIGDTYASTAPGTRNAPQTKGSKDSPEQWGNFRPDLRSCGIKPKNLIGIPWRLAFALQDDGWILRQEIVWVKPNPMPESVTDRCTKSHESIFLLSKSEKYYFDAGAIKEPAAPSSVQRWAQDVEGQIGSERVPGKTNGNMKAVGGKGGKNAFRGQGHYRDGDTGPANREGRDMKNVGASETRNKRNVWVAEEDEYQQFLQWKAAQEAQKSDVWAVATVPYKGAHFATFPPALIEPCILAGAPSGGVALDPFFGSGTTGAVAQNLGRKFIGCELNPAYKPLQDERLCQPSFEFAEGDA